MKVVYLHSIVSIFFSTTKVYSFATVPIVLKHYFRLDFDIVLLSYF